MVATLSRCWARPLCLRCSIRAWWRCSGAVDAWRPAARAHAAVCPSHGASAAALQCWMRLKSPRVCNPALSSLGGHAPEQQQKPPSLCRQHDDGVNGRARDMLRAITDGRQSLNGCPLTATLFAKIGNTGEGPAWPVRRAGAAGPGLHEGHEWQHLGGALQGKQPGAHALRTPTPPRLPLPFQTARR